MRRNSCTVVVLAGPVPGEVLAAVGRSMNVTLYRPERPAGQDGDGLAAAAEAAAGVLRALGSLRHGPWWPGLDEVIETARRFYPDDLAEGAATGAPPATPEAGRVRAG